MLKSKLSVATMLSMAALGGMFGAQATTRKASKPQPASIGNTPEIRAWNDNVEARNAQRKLDRAMSARVQSREAA